MPNRTRPQAPFADWMATPSPGLSDDDNEHDVGFGGPVAADFKTFTAPDARFAQQHRQNSDFTQQSFQQSGSLTAFPSTRMTIKAELGTQQQSQCAAADPTAAKMNDYDAADYNADIHHDLMFRRIIQDIFTTCSELSLPTDPNVWTMDHCNAWIQCMVRQLQIPSVCRLNINGKDLLRMSANDMTRMIPNGGEKLHDQFQVWKIAMQPYNQDSFCGPHAFTAPSTHCVQRSAAVPPFYGNGHRVGPASSSSSISSCYDHNSDTESNSNDYSPFPHSYYEHQPQQQQQYVPTATQHPSHNYYEPHVLNNGQMSPGQVSSSGSSEPDLDLTDMSGLHSNFHPALLYQQHHQPQPHQHQHHQHQQQHYYNTYANQQLGTQPLQIPFATPTTNNDTPFPDASMSAASAGRTVHLWQFIIELLENPGEYASCVRWVDRETGTFKIESSQHLARLWGKRKNRSQMNYDKLSRSLRQYYKKGIIQKPPQRQRLVYKFKLPIEKMLYGR